MILSLDSPYARLSNTGGKGMNLARMAREGFPVPGGVIITTEAYRLYVEVNDLEAKIEREIGGLDTTSIEALEGAAQNIRTAFRSGQMPLILESALRETHLPIENQPVAVRSSATAEDLPDSSFAGQQDTYLNIRGYEKLRSAVIDCWSSLWTARAIAYRARNGIPHKTAALAVVVQEMVEAETSGVLFTANPLTGARMEMVIDATFGLGEALVSGQVEPDHYIVNADSLEIIERHIGSKNVILQSAPEGGLEQRSPYPLTTPSLPDEVILDLAHLGARVQASYNAPQDIEWAWANGKLYLLQARPITSLFPLPDGPSAPLRTFFSFGAVQGMLDPMTPLGRDVIRLIFAGGASLFGYDRTHTSQGVIFTAGERLWGEFTAIIRNSVGRKAILLIGNVIEPGTKPIFEALLEEESLKPAHSGISIRTMMRFIGFAARMGFRLLRSLLNPERSRRTAIRESEKILALIGTSARAIGGEPEFKLRRRVELLGQIRDAFPQAVPLFVPPLAAGLGPFNLIFRLANQAGIPDELVLQISRGLPHNVTTEMDLHLWQAATEIRKDPAAAEYYSRASMAEIAAGFSDQTLPPVIQAALAGFLDRYGGRGLAEIDFGRQRWRDEPSPIFGSIQSYLLIPEDQAPATIFERGRRTAEDAKKEIGRRLRSGRNGFVKEKLFSWAYHRFRALAGLRESPKFHIVQMMDPIRIGLQDSATELVMTGRLDSREDIFFLTYDELLHIAAHETGAETFKETIRLRRNEYARELRRRQIPRIILSDGRTYYEAPDTVSGENGNMLVGSPVSPGTVEGRAHVVRDPRTAGIQPGEILVCPGTDPSWTPLFLVAGGLVMEVGGMMTHGSVVAREYGIPAVVGVSRATERLQTGMLLRVNGSSGKIEILDEFD